MARPGTQASRGTRGATPAHQRQRSGLQAVVETYRSGKVAEAGRQARKLLRRSPKTLVLYDILAAALIAEGKTAEAAACYRKALKVDPRHLTAHCNLGVLLRQLGDLQGAIASCVRALEIDPSHVQTLNNLGLALQVSGDLAGAVDRYAQAIDREPGYGMAHSNLGNTLKELGRYDEAEQSHRKAVQLLPRSSQVHNNLGNVLVLLRNYDEAALCYGQALRLAPGTHETLLSFAQSLRHVTHASHLAPFQDLVAQCFSDTSVASGWVETVSHTVLKAKFGALLADESLSLEEIAQLDRSTDGLLTSHLENGIIADSQLESFLAGVRRQLIAALVQGRGAAFADDALLQLFCTLGRQAFLNEYVWDIGEEEAEWVDTLVEDICGQLRRQEQPEAAALYAIAAYRPLFDITPIRDWGLALDRDGDRPLDRLLDAVIRQPDEERRIAEEIPTMTPIGDATSQAVRSQYEENPYPRWTGCSAVSPLGYVERVLGAITPHTPSLKAWTEAPQILVAGCGTGHHPVSTARACLNADVLAVDLSRASLAYGKRMAQALGITNVEFAQADILELGALDRQFDVIECGGVLHHMADPPAGLKVLVDRLRPGGFLFVALYSERARQSIVRMRQLVADKGFEPSVEGIRALRRFVRVSRHPDLAAIQKVNDFYATSEIRDLIFHVQEHRFDVPGIDALLKAGDLEFLGFTFKQEQHKTRFRERFPDDPDCLNLDHWRRFEEDNPETFAEMYQFWCRRPG